MATATSKPAAAAAAPAKKKPVSGLLADMRQHLGARYHLIWVVTSEERRAERIIAEAAAKETYLTRYWDCAKGACDSEGKKVEVGGNGVPPTHPFAVFDKIRKREESAVWVMRSLHRWLGDTMVCRGLQSIARDLQDELDVDRLCAIVVLAPTGDVPVDLRPYTVVIDCPLPTREELGALLDRALTQTGTGDKLAEGDRERIVDAAAGLTAEDAGNAYSLSIVRHGKVEPAEVAKAKQQIINRGGLLRWTPPDPRGMDAIGGLDLLKAWVSKRRRAFTPEARKYQLPPVKGLLVTGPPGTGKSLTAKCVGTTFEIPLVRLDLGALKGSLMGQSESNIREALRTAEAIQRCVLWIDEVDKALAGAKGPSGDSGVAADQLGTLLTWREECDLPIFLVATCNDPLALPPELVSRFDDTFFVDLPTVEERPEVLAANIRKYGRSPSAFDLRSVAMMTEGFSGRELKKLFEAAMVNAFDEGREVVTEDMLAVCTGDDAMVPVSKANADAIEKQRLWATGGRARLASRISPTLTGGGERAMRLRAPQVEE